MKKSIKFLMIFVLVFIISMLTQICTNEVKAAAIFNTSDTYIKGDLYYKWSSGEYWIVDEVRNDYVYSITIPSELWGYPLKAIASYSFAFNDNLTSVTIPNTIEIIGSSAFSGCDGLESITLPSSVTTLGQYAFGNCQNLSYVKLNEGLEMIGAESFYWCSSLKTIVIPSSVEFIGVDAFYGGYGHSLTMYGSRNSVAETFANKYDYITFKDKDMPFSDVSSNSWYYNAVKYAYSKGIMTGYTSTKFAPNDKITRGMFIMVLWKKEGSPYASSINQFVDVGNNDYYASAITWGVNNKIISGYNSSYFGPTDYITREQIAVILQQYCKYKGDNAKSTGNLTGFSDYKNVSSYATWGMKWAVGSGVITGSSGKLQPKANATRAEVAAMMQKYCYSFK